jgi:hypothetical protein
VKVHARIASATVAPSANAIIDAAVTKTLLKRLLAQPSVSCFLPTCTLALLSAWCQPSLGWSLTPEVTARAGQQEARDRTARRRLVRLPLTRADVSVGRLPVAEGIVWYTRGGLLTTTFSSRPTSVALLVKRCKGKAGGNGTFFAADSASCLARPIGPMLTSAPARFVPADAYDSRVCRGRPLVLVSDTHLVVASYAPSDGATVSALRQTLPRAREAFVAGAWLVHGGRAALADSFAHDSVRDAQTFRRRMALGLDARGRIILAATAFSGFVNPLWPILMANVGPPMVAGLTTLSSCALPASFGTGRTPCRSR